MDPVLFASFLAATMVIVVSPGPSVALASSQAVKHGPRAALLTVAGDALGTVVHILVAVISLGTLLRLADMILPVLQIAGGGFILWLAWQTLRSTQQSTTTPALPADRSAFLAGFFACVTNPKAIVFFVALFPGFISADLPVAPQSLVYGLVFVLLDTACILSYALLAMHLVRSTLAPRIDIDRLSAFGLLGVGLLLIWKGWRALPGAL